MPPRAVYERFYEEAYADYYGHISPAPLGTLAKVEPACFTDKFELIARLRQGPGCRFLEVGPGQGLFLWWAKDRGYEVLGVEPSPEFCDVLAKAELPFVPGTLSDVDPERHGRFDVVFMAHVLEHFYDPNETLKQCRELLVPGGILVVEVPNILKPFRSLDRYFLRYVHPSNFSPQTLQAMLQKHGFQTRHVNDAGDSDWRSPQNLFLIAQKRDSVPTDISFEVQQPSEVKQMLNRYRRVWRLKRAPLWHGHTFLANVRRKCYKMVRPVKQSLVGMLSSDA